MKFLYALRDLLSLRPPCPCCETWHSTERVESVRYMDGGRLRIDIGCHCKSCGAWFTECIQETDRGIQVDYEEPDEYDHNGTDPEAGE